MPARPTQVAQANFAAAGDRLGIVGSVLCAVHCALLPVALAALPALGLTSAALIDLDQAFTVFATLLGVSMLTVGWRRHRALHGWLCLIPGLALIWLGSFGTLHTHSGVHTLVMVTGGLAIAAAHLVNLRLTHGAIARTFAADAA